MQKPTFFKLSTFIYGAAAILAAAAMIFTSPASGQQFLASTGQQASTSGTQENPPPASSTKQDSSAGSTTGKTPAKTTPEAKPAAKTPLTAKKPGTATTPQTKGTATSASQNTPAKTASQADAPAKTASQLGAPAKTASTAKKGRTSRAKTTPVLTLNTQKDKASYAIGMNVGRAMKRDGLDVDTSILLRGINDALADSKPLMTDQEAQTVMTALQADMRKAQEEKMKQLAEANKKEGDEFLAANKAKEGVVALPSGVQYKILQDGMGPKPTATDTVVVNYRGTLVNGTEFDSSYKRGQPATFPVGGGIIRGWTEALQLMPVGSKWQVFIPSDLAYGPQGRPPMIGPNSTLVFEVELVSIQPKPAAAPAPAAAAPAPGAAPAPSPPPASPTPKPTPNPAPPPNTNPAPPNPTPTPPPVPKPEPTTTPAATPPKP